MYYIIESDSVFLYLCILGTSVMYSSEKEQKNILDNILTISIQACIALFQTWIRSEYRIALLLYHYILLGDFSQCTDIANFR